MARESLLPDSLLCLLVGLVLFLNALGGEFIYDDRSYVQENPSVLGGAPVFLEATPPGREDLGLYRPLTILSYRLTFRFAGLDPFTFHLVNALLHGLVAALVPLVARACGAGRGAALLAGLLFAAHPVHVEAVAWVVGRAELLATFFALLALLAHGRPAGDRLLLRPLLAAPLVLAAALAKETALPLPALLVALDLIRRERSPLRLVLLRAVPAALAVALVVLLRLHVLGRFGPDVAADPYLGGLDSAERARLGLGVLGQSTLKLLWPHPLSIHYDPRHVTAPLALACGALALIALILPLAGAGSRTRPALRAGVLLFLVGLLPFLHVVPIGAVFADRFLYLASAGFFLAAADLLLPATGSRPAPLLVALAAGLLALAALTLERNAVFRDPIALWQDAAESDPDDPIPLFQLAGEYDRAGLLHYESAGRRGALHYYAESLRVAPGHPYAPQAHVKLGEHQAGALGDARAAAAHYRQALELAPFYVDAMLDLAALQPSGVIATAEARELLERALGAARDERQRAAARDLLLSLPAD